MDDGLKMCLMTADDRFLEFQIHVPEEQRLGVQRFPSDPYGEISDLLTDRFSRFTSLTHL